MLPTVEQVLASRIAQQNEGLGSTEAAGTMGAALGGVIGVGLGSIPHGAGNAVNQMLGRNSNKSIGRRIRPGFRVAGGLMGLILGGGLGSGLRQQMIDTSPEARLMAKLQVDGDLSFEDKEELKTLLTQSYKNIGVA